MLFQNKIALMLGLGCASLTRVVPWCRDDLLSARFLKTTIRKGDEKRVETQNTFCVRVPSNCLPSSFDSVIEN